MSDMTQDEAIAYAEVIAEMAEYKRIANGRDNLIRKADGHGVPKAEIARRMDVSRDTVIRILGSDDESEV